MIATEFEYRHRFWMIALIYAGTYAFYNLDHLNILYAVIPWNQGILEKDMLARLLYATATLIAAAGAILLTWATAYRPPIVDRNPTALSIGGPFRYARNPLYLAYFLLILALGTFQSRLGFPVMIAGETILLLRLIGREEEWLEKQHGKVFLIYAQHVPRLLPSLRPRYENDNSSPHWRQAIWEQAFQWGFVATLLAFACTLSDPIGYAFAYMTLAFLILQKISQWLWVRLERNRIMSNK